jgi:hypothetical protein
MDFWVGFAIAYALAGGLVLRMIVSSHAAMHPGEPRSLGADLYVFFIWPAILTRLGSDR